MINYINKEENYAWKRYMLLRGISPAAFAEFCGTIHINQLDEEIEKLIPEIMESKIEEEMFKVQYEEYKLYFIGFIKRAAKAIQSNNLLNIYPEEEKYVLFAQETILQ